MGALTLDKALLLLRDFLVVWISQILYYNHIYEDNAYEKRQYLNVVVYQSRVPDLSKYLESFANLMIRVLVEKASGGKVHEVIVVIYDESKLHVHKRYVANFSQFVGLADKISLMDFLDGAIGVHVAKVNVPDMTWTNLHNSMRSMMFYHVEELKRTEEAAPNDYFFKLLLNVDGQVQLNSSDTTWVQLTSQNDSRPAKYVLVGEMDVGFLCFDLHNEYVMR
ncbi:CIC11C00000003331 [Sungouiella intermedia]|uniref:CIC11C00000003331 n=1 Tax=Sungouiella intermedia TaxID=45354 RepID=A0A1L0DPQ3_9ASCO|nr:CIC11C00000003331 [[Candida] intermedia]